MGKDFYDEAFYDAQVTGSLQSARVFLLHLFSVWRPNSVVDIGCGHGAWLAVCAEQGVQRLLGLDGNWVTKEQMLDSRVEFRPADLNEEIAAAEAFDLAMSLEVAEHLKPHASERFIRSLTSHAGAVMFGAAFAAQPGTDHINTRLHSYWADIFLASGYRLFDFFRPTLWSDKRVNPWYRQNTFLYVKPSHPLHDVLLRSGYRPEADARFVDAIHPWLYFAALGQLKSALRQPVFSQAPTKPAGRNEPCPCGSGKKYKHCHGRSDATASA